MAYSDGATVRAELWETTTYEVSPEKMTRFTELAANHIDRTLATAYSVPFSTPYPAIIVDLSDRLTVYFGLVYTGGLAGGEPSYIALFKSALIELEDLARGRTKGKARVGIPGIARIDHIAPFSNTSGKHGVFGRVPVVEQGMSESLIETERELREDD